MSKKFEYPKVLIVGRTNVGKSTFFNRISSSKNIVFDSEGVTRDYIKETVEFDNKKFDLYDTGGISLKKTKDPILEKIREKVLNLLNSANLLLFMCDGKNGLIDEDRQIAKILHKLGKPVILLINKADNINALEENMPEFLSLGFKEIMPISSIHGTGITDLLEKIIKIIPDKIESSTKFSKKAAYNVAIIGKPNAGKSSLLNLLVKKERAIVHHEAGTTREAISENSYCAEDLIQLTDTAGIRKKSRVTEKLESLMVKSSFDALRNSDIIILLVDASAFKLQDQELKLLFYIFEEKKKSIILVFNKIDLLTEADKKLLDYNLEEYEFILKKIPVLYISCKTERNVNKIFREIQRAWIRRNQTFEDLAVTELIKKSLIEKPLYHKKNLLKIHKVKCLPNNIPTFQLHVNQPEWFEETQLGFVENVLRKNYDLKGCPIQFELLKRRG